MQKMPPASNQVSATPLKLMIQQIHPHVRVERDSGMCVAHDLYELWGRGPYTRMLFEQKHLFFYVWCLLISPTHKRTEGRAPVRDSEFTTKVATVQGGVRRICTKV